MDQTLKNLQSEIENLENQILSNPSELFDDEFYGIERQYEEIRHFQYNEFDTNVLKNLGKRIKRIREDLDVYDEQGERDAMFPNGEDE